MKKGTSEVSITGETTGKWNGSKIKKASKISTKTEYTKEQSADIKKLVKVAKEKGRQIGMVQGICLAIANRLKGYDERETWGSSGLTIEECDKLGVDDYDLDTIRENISKLR